MDNLTVMLGPLLAGTAMTLKLFIVTMVLSVPLGLLLTLLRLSRFRAAGRIIGGYIWLMRGTPLMLQMFFIYYTLPAIGITLPGFVAAAVAFALNYAAYFTEIFRSGIQSISKGQHEAAKVLGLSYAQTLRRIILPQMWKRVLPPFGNETITLVKDTALLYVLAIGDLMHVAKSIVQRDFNTSAFVVAAVFYLVMTAVLTRIFQHAENKYAVYDE